MLCIYFVTFLLQSKSSCRDGCSIHIDVIEPTAIHENSLPAPIFAPHLLEASTELGRDPGIYDINYNLEDQKNNGSTTNNLTTFIFRVQTATTSQFYFKVRWYSLSACAWDVWRVKLELPVSQTGIVSFRCVYETRDQSSLNYRSDRIAAFRCLYDLVIHLEAVQITCFQVHVAYKYMHFPL